MCMCVFFYFQSPMAGLYVRFNKYAIIVSIFKKEDRTDCGKLQRDLSTVYRRKNIARIIPNIH